METQELTLIDHKQYGLEENDAKSITEGLSQILSERTILEQQYASIIKQEITEELSEKAKTLKAQIVKNRTQGINEWHKKNKAFYLAGGRFVDAIKNKEIIINERMESQLDEIAKYQENIQKQALAKLREDRLAEIMPYLESEPHSIELMDEDVFKNFLMGAKISFEQKEAQRIALELAEKENARLDTVEQERKIEIAPYVEYVNTDDKIDLRAMNDVDYSKLLSSLKDSHSTYLENQEKIRKENEVLAKKNAEIQKLADEQQAKLKAELKAKEDAENKRIAESNAKILEEARLKELELKKGDSEKFNDLIQDLTNLTTKYQLTSHNGRKLMSDTNTLIEKVINHIKNNK